MTSKPIYDVRHIRDLKDMISQSVNLYGSKDAFLVKDKSSDSYRGIKYTDFSDDINALGTALISMGLKDKSVALIGENRYEWCLTYLSVANGVGVIVPLDKELVLDEIERLLVCSEAAAIIFSGKVSPNIIKLAPDMPSVKFFINMDLEQDEDGFLSFKQLVQKGRELISKGDSSYMDSEIDPDKMSILLYTSGTTGNSKGVMLSHRNICFDITSVRSTVFIGSNDSSLSILPLHHTYECSLGFMAMMHSGAVISFNEGLKHIAKNLKEVKPTMLFAVPLLLENMYKKIWDKASKQKGAVLKLKLAILISDFLYKFLHIDLRRKLFKPIHENFGGKLRLILTGAAAIDPAVSKGFRSMGISVLQGYGLTECSPLVTGNNDKMFKDSSIGLPIPGVEVKVKDPDENGIGEIIVKGDNVMLGYYKDEDTTKNILKDGWFHTGDLGYADKSGFFHITGRSKNVIVTKNGKKVFPEEIEAYINKNPFVQESLVWGKYDSQSGETFVNAQIVPNFEMIKEKLKEIPPSKEDIMKIMSEAIKKVNGNMPLYKHIREFTVRENEFVKTTTKKIKRYIEEKAIQA